MLLETGRVESVAQGKATILVQRSSACKSCGARGICLTLGSMERTVEVLDPLGVTVGDEVQIGIPPGPVVWASVVVYVFPVASMLAGALLGMHLAPEGRGDEAAALGCFGALGASLALVWLYDRTQRGNDDRIPSIVRIVGAGPAGRDEAACADDERSVRRDDRFDEAAR
jgi:sigma-E factor negative regulatory protein RseC